MPEKKRFQVIKGTRDLLPPETELWNRVEATAREVFGTFGFGEIRPPVFEVTDLFGRAIGAETDIISKEMFTWQEGGTPIETELYKSWIITHAGTFSAPRREFFFNKQRPADLVVERGDQTIVVEFKRRTLSQASINYMRDFARDFSEQFPDKKLPKLLLVFAEEPSDFVRRLADANDVEIEVLEVPGYEEPESISLRPEATASVCRAYIEHGMQQWPAPVKLYYMGPMFRRERPQKGRYRQFYQIGAEVLGGTDAPGIDAEVIEMVMAFFARLELPGVQLEINSIGHSAANCRRGYVEKLRAALLEVKDKLGADSQRRIGTNPLRVLDSKLEHEQAIIATLPKIGDSLCDECKAHYAEVKRQLEMRGVAYRENWRLVRGLDYYMRTTFEITAQGLGSQNAVCGGGRYDGLVELLGGPPTKGIGFAIGEDRLILSLSDVKKEVASDKWRAASGENAKSGSLDDGGSAKPGVRSSGQARAASRCDVYVAWMGEGSEATAIRAARNLREAGLRVELPAGEQKFGKALGQADKLGAKFALILGEDEVASAEWTVKNLADGTQEKVREDGVVEFLKRKNER
jgi:histidyl-tRNA synthetase